MPTAYAREAAPRKEQFLEIVDLKKMRDNIWWLWYSYVNTFCDVEVFFR